MKLLAVLLFLLTITYSQSSKQIHLNDGKIFDKGMELKEPSSNAPSELGLLSPLIGEWNVLLKTRTSDSTFYEAEGYSRFTYLNRGHSIMEKFYSHDFNGEGDELNTISFIAFNAQNNIWNIGIADSYKESIAMYSGDKYENGLVLHNSMRKGGWLNLYYYRYSIKNINKNNFTITLETAANNIEDWEISQEFIYTKADNGLNIKFENENYGEFNNELPEEARQFDFLIGEWDAHHQILRPDGTYINFNSNASAVYVLNGNAIMEHDWFDAKQGISDPGTSVLRIYNRVLRRWECLFLTNRNNANYYFGGVKEEDNIVLHPFDSDASAPAYSYFIFYNISDNDYSWHGQQTKDKGKTFTDTWIIEVDKK